MGVGDGCALEAPIGKYRRGDAVGARTTAVCVVGAGVLVPIAVFQKPQNNECSS
jgi:hypothetical protein